MKNEQIYEQVKSALYELTTNMEHQSTLWHATPFGMVFLSRILEKALAESERNSVAYFLVGELLTFLPVFFNVTMMGMKWNTLHRFRYSPIY